jgi:cystathionine beta-lyase
MYNFDEIVDRRNTESVKWDLYPGALPMWVADMDFRIAPEIQEALQRRLDHGVFGYELVPDSYFEAIGRWFSRRHGWEGILRENIVPTTGVIAAYSAAIKAMTVPGDKVLVQTPCYNAFFPAIRNNKCVQLENPLHYEDGLYTIDWEDFEDKVSQARVFLLCNPHNPAGRVWTREELERMGEICLRHKVFVVADEIHCELTYPGHDYTPWATLPEELVRNSVSCISPTKAFNIAGIQIANIFAKDPEILKKMDRAINDNECCDVNVFGVTALQAAYNQGEAWLDQLRGYLWHNARTVYCFLEDELPGITAPPLEGTYLMWLDCRGVMHPREPLEGFSERFAEQLKKHGLVLSTGTIYGAAGEGFERLNIACPRTVLLEGLRRLKETVEQY